jgi:hypothetical protein
VSVQPLCTGTVHNIDRLESLNRTRLLDTPPEQAGENKIGKLVKPLHHGNSERLFFVRVTQKEPMRITTPRRQSESKSEES